MQEFNSFETPFEYSERDRYIRAVRFNLIRRNGEIKAGAFKSNRGGVSVTRSNDVLFNRALSYMKLNFEGKMAVFPVKICSMASIFEKHSPSKSNIHHWELCGGIDCSGLNEEQIDQLIDAAEFEE